MLTEQDQAHMRRALGLAERGRGRVSPNPLVGAVIVRDGEMVGEGYHAELGGLHAETAAIADCRARGEDPRGATMYVTLEPCAHQGRQPPCVDAIVAAGIARVVIGSDDPSEKASGRGPGILRDEGIAVTSAEGAEASAARLLNQPFRKHARTGCPLVSLKAALTLDGRTATRAGDSKWISGESSRGLVHRWRAESDAVAVGIGTALADDPLLTARGVDAARQPIRVVFDGAARLPLSSRLMRSLGDAPVIVLARADAPTERVRALRDAGAEMIQLDGDGPEHARRGIVALGERGVTSLLVEGGATLAGSLLDSGEVDQLQLFIAPVVVGGVEARPLLGGEGSERIEDAVRALAMEFEASGEDLLVRARLREW